jgi:hypothetical protein
MDLNCPYLYRNKSRLPNASFGRNQTADFGLRIEEALTLIIRNLIVGRKAASVNMRAKRKEVSE